jgi:diguanylate cyclase (GGDEF)-like protein
MRGEMFKKKILVIEDSVFYAKHLSDILINAEYEPIIASDGLTGIRLVKEEKPDLVLLDVIMPGIDGFEVCKMLREDEGNNLMPIIILTSQVNEDDKLTGLELGADDYITKPFNERELVGRVKNTLVRIDRNRRANPLTGMQGNLEIQSEINTRIARGEIFAVIYIDIDHFKAYNDVYGFAKGDTAIKIVADIISDNIGIFGDNRNFSGHIGGDDFVIITSLPLVNEICEGIITDFDKKILEVYREEHRIAGFISARTRKGEVCEYPIMTLSIAVITNESRTFVNHLQVAEVAAELKKKAKAYNYSNYVKDMRKE